jgi:hypothetical protein
MTEAVSLVSALLSHKTAARMRLRIFAIKLSMTGLTVNQPVTLVFRSIQHEDLSPVISQLQQH